MRRTRLVLVSFLALLGFSQAAAAQGLVTPPLFPTPAAIDIESLTVDQERELTRWLSAIFDWQRYDAKWRNRPVHDGWGRIAPRRSVPEPPAWLDGRCAQMSAARVLSLDDRMTSACRLLDDPRTSLGSAQSSQRVTALAAEKPSTRSSFLTRLHIDGLWTTASTSGRVYGLVGSHMSLADVGRLQIFGPPGVILLSVPDINGSRRVTLGYTWGVSVRLSDMRLFGQRDMTLFLNVSKVWVNARSDTPNARGFEAIGFSIAPRKNR